MSPDSDIVSAQGISKYLTAELNIEVYDEVVSTNTMLKERASSGAPEGLVIIANSQTGGNTYEHHLHHIEVLQNKHILNLLH